MMTRRWTEEPNGTSGTYSANTYGGSNSSSTSRDYNNTYSNNNYNRNTGGGGGGGGYYGRSGGGGGGRGNNYSGGGSSSFGAKLNARGFHGDMSINKRLEAQLFDNSEKQTTGINFDNYDKIPIEVSGQSIPDPIDLYSEESIGEDLFRNSILCGYAKPTPVQKYSIPIGTMGRDLMACAQTGSGKTAGFLFPVIMSLIKSGGTPIPEPRGHRMTKRSYPEGLVLAPTRELAQQIYEEARRFTYATGIAPVCIYGGADVHDQLRFMESHGCDLLIGTPGRLVDFIERGRVTMEHVRLLVLDEADRMYVMIPTTKARYIYL
jgi:ATP-dependent RNA helicase DDX3X